MSTHSFCSACGHQHVPGALYCGRCGEGVSRPPGGDAAGLGSSGRGGMLDGEIAESSGGLPDRPARRLSVHALLVAGVVLLLALVGVLGAALLLQDGSSNTPVSPIAAPTGATSEAPTTGATGSVEGDTSAPPIRCWDNAPAESYSACPALRGVAAMRWLFPALGRDFSSCEPASAYDGKLRAYACKVEVPGDHGARVVYSEWTTFAIGDGHYRRKYGSPDRLDSVFNVWATVYVSERFQTSRMYSSSLPFSVTVASKSERSATQIMSRLESRSPAAINRYLNNG